MQQIYDTLKEADALILATPIYFTNISTYAKIFLDRMYAWYLTNPTEKYGRKKISIIATQGSDVPEFNDVMRGNMEMTAICFDSLSFDKVDVEILLETNEPGCVADNDEYLEIAAQVGLNIIK